MLYAEELRNAIYIFLSNFAKFHEYVQFYLYGDQWSIKWIIVQQKKKNLMNLISINHAFYFFIYGLKAYNM